MTSPPSNISYKLIGRGGFGLIYQISEEGKEYVRKILQNSKDDAKERFKREITILRYLSKQKLDINVPPLLFAGQLRDGREFYDMPLYSNGSLR